MKMKKSIAIVLAIIVVLSTAGIPAWAAELYDVNYSQSPNGSFLVKDNSGSLTQNHEGSVFVIKPTPDAGYKIGSVTVTAADGSTVSTEMKINSDGEAVWWVTMPASAINIDVVFEAIENPSPTQPGETDVPKEPSTEEPTQPSVIPTEPEPTQPVQPSEPTVVKPVDKPTAPAQPKPGKAVQDQKSNAVYVVTKTGKNAGDNSVAYQKPKDKKETDIVVPATVKIAGKTYQVTKITDNAFKGNSKVKSVKIGANVQTIGANAFNKCTKLKSVSISGKVKTIQKGAFAECKNLKTITIKTTNLTMKSVGKDAFKGIPENTVVKVPKGEVKEYKKILQARGLSKKVKIKSM